MVRAIVCYLEHWSNKRDVFSKMKACSSNADICINGEKIEIVTDFNYLGLTFDSHRSLKKHVKKLVRTKKI